MYVRFAKQAQTSVTAAFLLIVLPFEFVSVDN